MVPHILTSTPTYGVLSLLRQQRELKLRVYPSKSFQTASSEGPTNMMTGRTNLLLKVYLGPVIADGHEMGHHRRIIDGLSRREHRRDPVGDIKWLLTELESLSPCTGCLPPISVLRSQGQACNSG